MLGSFLQEFMMKGNANSNLSNQANISWYIFSRGYHLWVFLLMNTMKEQFVNKGIFRLHQWDIIRRSFLSGCLSVCPMSVLWWCVPAFMLTFPSQSSDISSPNQTDNWIFIKIRFSNRPSPALSNRKVSKNQDRALYPKQKMLIYVSRFLNMLWNKLRPQDMPMGAKMFLDP